MSWQCAYCNQSSEFPLQKTVWDMKYKIPKRCDYHWHCYDKRLLELTSPEEIEGKR